MESRSGAQRLPPIVRSLVSGILRGDTDSSSLMAAGTAGLLIGDNVTSSQLRQPTAVRARWFKYFYAEFGEAGRWWRREPMHGKDGIQLFLAEAERSSKTVTRSPPQRQWLLALAVTGLVGAASAATAAEPSCAQAMSAVRRALAVLQLATPCVLIFGCALLADYPELALSQLIRSSASSVKLAVASGSDTSSAMTDSLQLAGAISAASTLIHVTTAAVLVLLRHRGTGNLDSRWFLSMAVVMATSTVVAATGIQFALKLDNTAQA